MSEDGLRIAFVGVGQCGGNIANEFAKLGYPAVAINTAASDLGKLTDIPQADRLLINLGIQGAGKNPEIGEDAFIMHSDDIMELLSAAFPDMPDMLYVCAGLGGGTGSGAAPILCAFLAEKEYSVGAVVTLPSDTEAPKVQLVASAAFSKLSKVQGLKSLFIVDNSKAADPTLGLKMQYGITNVNIAKQFADLSALTSADSDMAFDARDFISLLETPGVALLSVLRIEDLKEFSGVAAQEVTAALRRDLFADTELTGANGLAIVFETGQGGASYITQETVARIQHALGDPFDISTAIYESDSKHSVRSAVLRLLVTGLPVPKDRLDRLSISYEEREKVIAEKREKAADIEYSGTAADALGGLAKKAAPKPAGTNSVLEGIAKRKAELAAGKRRR